MNGGDGLQFVQANCRMATAIGIATGHASRRPRQAMRLFAAIARSTSTSARNAAE